MIINYSDHKVIKNKKSIFLGGPTPRDKSIKSWRNDACEILKESGFDGIVYVPEYSTWAPRVDYIDQVEWEREALSSASVIAFWVPRSIPDMPAFTTNVEFGYWIHSNKMLYGRPDNAVKVSYLDWLYKKDLKMDPFNNLEDLLIKSIELANASGINRKCKLLPIDKRKIMKENFYEQDSR